MVDFRMKNQIINDDLVKLYIWDTAGQERYRSIIGAYFKDCHGIVLVFDMSNAATFQSIQSHWVKLCKEKCQEAVLVLVANKMDLGKKKVKYEQIDEFCKTYSCKFFEVSAKDGSSIEEMFIDVSYDIMDRFFS